MPDTKPIIEDLPAGWSVYAGKPIFVDIIGDTAEHHSQAVYEKIGVNEDGSPKFVYRRDLSFTYHPPAPAAVPNPQIVQIANGFVYWSDGSQTLDDGWVTPTTMPDPLTNFRGPRS
jgi:hypothetical protein